MLIARLGLPQDEREPSTDENDSKEFFNRRLFIEDDKGRDEH